MESITFFTNESLNARKISRLSRQLRAESMFSSPRTPCQQLLLFATDIEQGKGSSKTTRGVTSPTNYVCYTLCAVCASAIATFIYTSRLFHGCAIDTID